MKEESDLPNGVLKTILMNQLKGINFQEREVYLQTYLASLNEAKKLLNEAEVLYENQSYERAYFLGFSALEEISKSQLSADVYTGFIEEKIFRKAYRSHNEKISRVEWIKIDGNSFPCFSYDKVRIKDFDFKKKLKSMYVDIDFKLRKVSTPNDSISKNDAANIIKAVRVGLYRIHEVTVENGEQIGTKGFMK